MDTDRDTKRHGRHRLGHHHERYDVAALYYRETERILPDTEDWIDELADRAIPEQEHD